MNGIRRPSDMNSEAKFFICGRGIWRELNLDNGDVDGWGKPTFLYVRGGKVEVVRSKTVLQALRDHKNGLNSAVSVGAELRYKKVHQYKKRHKRHRGSSPCTHAQCCHGVNINGYLAPPVKTRRKKLPFKEVEINVIKKVDVEIQTNPPSQSLFPESKNTASIKRRRQRVTSSDENVQCKITTAAMVHSRSPKKINKIVMRKKWSIASKEKLSSTKLSKQSVEHNLYKRKRANSSDSVWDVLPNNKGSNAKDSSSEETTKLAQRKAKKNELHKMTLHSRLGSQNKKFALDHVIENKVKKRAVAESMTSVKTDIKSNTKLTNKTLNDNNIRETAKADDVTELIIDEDDLELLRNYFMNNLPDFDLLQFDADDEYKRQLLYKIIPLVNIERCPKIAKMIRRDSFDEISLKDFAYHLGLTSVSETSQPQRYKMRNTKERRNLNKEKNKIDKTHKKVNRGILNSSSTNSDSEIQTKDRNKRKSYNGLRKNFSTDSDTELDSVEEIKRKKKSIKQSRNRSSGTYEEVSNSDTETESEAQETRHKNFAKTKRGRNEIKSAKKNASKDARVVKIGKKTRNKIRMFSPGATDTSTFSTVEGRSLKKKAGNKEDGDGNSSVEITPSRILRERKSDNITLDLSFTSDDSEAFVKIAKHNTKEKNNRINNEASALDYNLDRLKKAKNQANKKSQNSRNFDANENNNKYIIHDKNKAINSPSNRQKNRHDKKGDSSNRLNSGNKSDLNVSKNRRGNITKSENNSEDDRRRSTRLNTSNIQKLSNDKNNMADASDDNSIHDHNPRTTRQSKNKTDPKSDNKLTNSEDNNKLKVRISKTSPSLLKGRISKTSPSKPKNKHDDTTETVNLSEDDENEVFAKKPIISQVRSLVVKTNRTPSSLSKARLEYSNMEDHAIVSWVSQGGRPRCVNGNRIWRELQDQYYNISGQYRTWHSLRNRYLRSILPRLGSLALDPSLVARLRAAAASGEIKGRHKNFRRNSIFGVATVGALSRRRRRSSSSGSDEELLPPKKHKHDNRVKESLPTRVLRSSLPSSTDQAARSPGYSDILQKYADTHRYHSISTLSPVSRKNSPEKKKSEKSDNTTNTKNSLGISHRSSVTKMSTPNADSATKVSTPKDGSKAKVATPKKNPSFKVSTPKASPTKTSIDNLSLQLRTKSAKNNSRIKKDDFRARTAAASDTLPESMKYLKERKNTRKLYNPIGLL